MAALFDENGAIDRPYPGRLNRVPAVIDLKDDVITWRWGDKHEENPDRPPAKAPDLLLEFARLSDPKSGADRILAFAKKWGVLEICHHGLPYSHNHLQEYFLPNNYCTPLRYSDGDRRYYEPIRRWWFFAAQARALLSVTARLRQGKPGLRKDWMVIFNWRPEDMHPPRFHGVDCDIDRQLVVYMVNRWLALGNVRPVLQRDGERVFVTFDTNLFGVLASQLMTAVSGTNRLGSCSACGMLYAPRRQPKSKQRNYCQGCREKKVPLRDAKADQRGRERGQ